MNESMTDEFNELRNVFDALFEPQDEAPDEAPE